MDLHNCQFRKCREFTLEPKIRCRRSSVTLGSIIAGFYCTCSFVFFISNLKEKKNQFNQVHHSFRLSVSVHLPAGSLVHHSVSLLLHRSIIPILNVFFFSFNNCLIHLIVFYCLGHRWGQFGKEALSNLIFPVIPRGSSLSSPYVSQNLFKITYLTNTRSRLLFSQGLSHLSRSFSFLSQDLAYLTPGYDKVPKHASIARRQHAIFVGRFSMKRWQNM